MSTDDRELAPDENQSLPLTDLDPKSVDPKTADEVKGGVRGIGAVVSQASGASATVYGTTGLSGNV